MKRGELWSAATGSRFGSKPRPVLVVQADAFADAPNIIVALQTSDLEGEHNLRPFVEPDETNNLTDPSLIQIDILVTGARHKFGGHIGRLTERDQGRVDSALLAYLGFAD